MPKAEAHSAFISWVKGQEEIRHCVDATRRRTSIEKWKKSATFRSQSCPWTQGPRSVTGKPEMGPMKT